MAWRLAGFPSGPFFLLNPPSKPVNTARGAHGRLRRRGGDDASGGGVDVLRRRTRASIDGLRGRRAAALRAGRRGHLSPLARGRPDLSVGVRQQGGRGRTLTPAPSDARFVSRLTRPLGRWRRSSHPNPSPSHVLLLRLLLTPLLTLLLL